MEEENRHLSLDSIKKDLCAMYDTIPHHLFKVREELSLSGGLATPVTNCPIRKIF